MKHTKCSIVLLLFLELVFFPSLAEGGKEVKSTSEQYQLSDKQKILLSAAKFRISVLENYEASLKKYASDKTQSWFKSIDERWWQDVPGEHIWQHLFVDAQMLFTNVNNNPLAIYYSVWPDVYLITEWGIVGAKAQIIDAEIVSGDFLRLPQNKNIQSTPLWSRSLPFLLKAVEDSVVVSLMQADKIFIDSQGKDWRKVSGLSDPLNNNRFLASRKVVMKNVLSSLENIYQFEELNETKYIAVRSIVYEMLAFIYFEMFDKFIIDNEIKISDVVEDYLVNIKASAINANIVAHVVGLKNSWIFITFAETPHILLSVHLERDARGRYKVRQIEALDYLSAYSHVTSN